MPEIEPSSLKAVLGDAVLVKYIPPPNMAGRLHVPESARKNDSGRRSAWKGEVVKFGEDVDFEQWKPHTVSPGDAVFISPEALDCPSFYAVEDDVKERYVFVRDEDIIGKEAS